MSALQWKYINKYANSNWVWWLHFVLSNVNALYWLVLTWWWAFRDVQPSCKALSLYTLSPKPSTFNLYMVTHNCGRIPYEIAPVDSHVLRGLNSKPYTSVWQSHNCGRIPYGIVLVGAMYVSLHPDIILWISDDIPQAIRTGSAVHPSSEGEKKQASKILFC